LKRSRTQDDNDTAIASVNIKEKLATSQAEIAKLERENRDLRYQMLTVRSETATAVRSLQQKLRDMSTEHGDAQVRIAALEEEMCAMRLNAMIAGMPALETQYRIDRAAKEMLDAQAKANAAEEQLQDAKTTIQARDQELRAAEAIIKARDKELQAANQQRKVAAPSAE
jgi:outer membrane murein-binding lipoprotein Lpp